MLARMDGASPVDYLNRPGERETARALGRAILGQQAASWKTTREIIRSHLPLGPGDA